ncbi:hypothetical protein DRE_04354 [Drechslerella stenobrocha 248]|uniref:Rhodopsin domain-containing protein n=1 Tax=Drechslerella stenobrocha 248 TaxID=1043628 RepID=W7HQH1_9PEZI|nr:hypothetical protein DRE_04354 [Drechslerella stenobrocha 248]
MKATVTPEELKHAMWLKDVAVSAHAAGINGPAPADFVPPWLLSDDYVVVNRQTSMYIIDVIFFVLAVMMVLMRIYTRLFIVRKFGRDDWFMVLALISVAGFTTLQFCFLVYGGVGYHIWDVTEEQIAYCFKFIYFHLIGYTWSITLIKMSILFLYERIIPTNHPMRKVLTGFMIFQFIYFLVSEFVFIFQCSPIEGALSLDLRIHGSPKCFGMKPMLYSFCIIHIFMDLALLVLPIRVIWELQMPMKRKITTLSLFVIGAIGCICAVMRVVTLAQLLDGFDFTWTIYDPGMWGLLELTIGIICACIPPSKLLFEKIGGGIVESKFSPFSSKGSSCKSDSSSSSPYNEKKGRVRSPAPSYGKVFSSTEMSFQSINKSVLMSQISERVDSFIVSKEGPIQPTITTLVEAPGNGDNDDSKPASFDTIRRPQQSFDAGRRYTTQVSATMAAPPSPNSSVPTLSKSIPLDDLMGEKQQEISFNIVAASCPSSLSSLEKAMDLEGGYDLGRPLPNFDDAEDRPQSGFSMTSGAAPSLGGKPVSGADWV